MAKQGRTQRKHPTGQPLAANASRNNSDPGDRQEDADQRKEASDMRRGTAKLRQQAADLRQGTAGQREVTADQREVIADLRQDTADNREDIANLREEAADLRHDTAELRQVTADLREEAANLREKTDRDAAKISASTQALLREANERLVIASINAQTLTEVAEEAATQMTYMAEHDFLTGLPNRALLTDRLAQAMALAQRHGKKVALMYLDLDHFKHINDSLGHAVGDLLLQSVATRLHACVPRHSDTVSRQGGDEFVVLLAEIETAQDAVLTAKKLIAAVAKPHHANGHQLHVTLSIGISLYPDDGKDVDTVIRNADTAMYQAKNSGRNKYKMFTPEMNVLAMARHSIVQSLHRAVNAHEFALHYQPKVNLKTKTVTGAEALLRWPRSGHRLSSPKQFVSIAEESGLIQTIGKWVLREACRQTQAWLQAGLDLGQIAVNVSAAEFHKKDFLSGIRTILDETGLDPRRLELELTESAMMQDLEQSTATLRALKKLGVQIAVDDFGTGYSSLSYLHRFPIDTLKIDRSFVQNSEGGPIVTAIIAMGTSLKQRIVAEGIETKKQLAFLQAQHCAEGQGFYFSRPVPAEKFVTLLESVRH